MSDRLGSADVKDLLTGVQSTLGKNGKGELPNPQLKKRHSGFHEDAAFEQQNT